LAGVKLFEKAYPNVKVNVVIYDANGSGDLPAKIALYNRAGSGWPDVVFSANNTDAAWASDDQYHFAAPLNTGSSPLVPNSVLNGFAAGSLAQCTFNGVVYCLRNDIAQDVLWYNKTEMKKFGYSVPTTWPQYQALGEEVAKQHPGYEIGSIAEPNSADAYFQASECPAQELVAPMTVEINTSDPNCKRMAKLLDPLIKDGTMSKISLGANDYVKNTGLTDKTLMCYGASWYGEYLFDDLYKVPKGEMAAALPPTWPGDRSTYTGDQGGGIWLVSSHAANPKLAAEVATFLATSTSFQGNPVLAPTYPAYAPAAKVWLKAVNASGYFAQNPAQVFAKTAQELWPGWGALTFDTDLVWANTVVAGIAAGKSLSSLLGPWETALKNEAGVSGYTVVKS
jgi:multiple sugar transport system substrate-binding protein